MAFHSHDKLRYYAFDSLEREVKHAFFTRHGGTSPQPWASLNLGSTVGDEIQRVRENRRLAFAAFDRPLESLFDVWQVHGTEVILAEAPRPLEAPFRQADAILTDRPGVTLVMRFADCVPILLYDPVRRVAGIAHAGWQGTVKGTARAAMEAMHSHYKSQPADVLAAIGPSICPQHYEVGPDVIARVRQAFGDAAGSLLLEKETGTHFDLWAANRLVLEQAGVKKIELSGLCTVCHNADWYSHRHERGRTGRFGAMIALYD
jgi:polyphenol oxidase